MKCQPIQTPDFENAIESLIAKRKVKKEDFEDFKKSLAGNPEQGDVIAGTRGIRKVRLKSATKGKSGGFRVIYFFIAPPGRIYMASIFAKSRKQTLSAADRNVLAKIASAIKKGTRGIS